MLLVMTISISTALTACGKDEPDTPNVTPNNPTVTPDDNKEPEDPFIDLYGYWLNTDKTGAMEIVRNTTTSCKIRYYVYSENLSQKYAVQESFYRGSGDYFTALATPDQRGYYGSLTVTISTQGYSQLVLKKNSGTYNLSSYIFSRVSESEFFEYLTNGGNNGNEPTTTGQLAGTNWGGKVDGIYVTLSFKKDGTFTEKWADETETWSSTYTELDSNTIIVGEGTVLYNTFGYDPFNYELNSNKTKLIFYNNYDRWELTRIQ